MEVNGRSEFATPVRIYLPTGEKVIDVVKNDRSSLILTTNGNVYLYGFNFAWQFSPSKEMYLHKPMKINLPDHAKITSIAISTGEYDNRYCIYLLTENRDVFVLGSNPWGQLGLGHPKDVYVPTKVNFYNNEKSKPSKLMTIMFFLFLSMMISMSVEETVTACLALDIATLLWRRLKFHFLRMKKLLISFTKEILWEQEGPFSSVLGKRLLFGQRLCG
ncbi:MAG: hypothetical protein HWD59_03400 [Coxiellaceae bacterium]|nr:MAG: hypothetical protein HWD59_03400 [Coxiellaceae bacterium]